jgi:hypothetical protein
MIVPSTDGFFNILKRQVKTNQQRFQKIILILCPGNKFYSLTIALPNGRVWFRRNYYVHAQGNQSA